MAASLNDGHRERLRRRYINEGLDHFEPHEVLELLLFYVIPRGNVNHVAHRLIQRFKTIAGVFEARPEELVKVEGIGEQAALYLSMMSSVCRRYMLSCSQDRGKHALYNSERVYEYIAPYFVGRTVETLYLICLNNAGVPVACSYISEGSINASKVDTRKIVEEVMHHDAVAVLLCHNHPKGLAIPSAEDFAVTREIEHILNAMGVALLDHLIVADGDYVSFSDTMMQEQAKKEAEAAKASQEAQ